VALQTEHVDVAEFQQVGVRRSVRDVAGSAALNLYRRVLEYKWAMLVHVALEADRVLRGRQAHLLGQFGAVRIMAIAALDQTLVDAVVKGHGELRLLLEVAGVAKLRLRLGEQEFFCLGVVRRMAGDTAYLVLFVQRVAGFHVLRRAGMAGKAAIVDFPGAVFGEDKNLRFVAAARNVRSARAVTPLASLVGGASLGVEHRFPVGRFFPIVVKLLVTCLTDFRANVAGIR